MLRAARQELETLSTIKIRNGVYSPSAAVFLLPAGISFHKKRERETIQYLDNYGANIRHQQRSKVQDVTKKHARLPNTKSKFVPEYDRYGFFLFRPIPIICRWNVTDYRQIQIIGR